MGSGTTLSGQNTSFTTEFAVGDDIRVNGEEKTLGTTNACADISLGAATADKQVTIGARENGSTSYDRQMSNCNLYEIHYIVSDTVNNEFLSDLEKLEGSLARKYNILDSLPADHTYKTKSPYGSPIKQGANRYG